MAISLVRIDDRMIHGQIVIMWTKFYQGDALVVLVDDETRKNPLLVSILQKAGAAMMKKVYVFDLEEATEKLPKVIASEKKYYLISKRLKELAEVHRRGIDFGKEVIFGTASQRPNTKGVYNNIYLSAEDVEDCKYLDSQGVKLNFKLIPSEKGLTWKDIEKQL